MQVIDKPKQFQLPMKFNPQLASEKSQSKLPNIYLGQSKVPKYSRMKSSTNFILRYSELQQSRGAIRTALSKNMNFEHVEGCEHSFLSQKLLEGLPQTVKPLGYKSSEHQIVLRVVKGIFGEDFSLSNKDILVTKGNVSGAFYIFFTSAYYRPQSFCCQSVIYLKLRSTPDRADDLYDPHLSQISQASPYSTVFICANCKKAVLNLKQQPPLKSKNPTDRLLRRQAIQEENFQKQRKKIMMSIMIASGRYKKALINDFSGLHSPKQTLDVSVVSTVPLRQKRLVQKNFDI